MVAVPTDSKAFYVKNCSLASIATGESANSLLEFRDKLINIDEGCIYHHFWGARMKPQTIHGHHHNDFASWTFHRLHDVILAEKLSIIDPTDYSHLEDLRIELILQVESRLDDYDIILTTKREDRFNFIRSTIVIFDSDVTIKEPQGLLEVIGTLTPSSIFYHFIDARRRTAEKINDFSLWLKTFGDSYIELAEQVQAIDPYFLSLTELRDEFFKVVQHYFSAKGHS